MKIGGHAKMAQKKPKKPVRPAPVKKGVAARKPVAGKSRAARPVARKAPAVARKPSPAKTCARSLITAR